MNATIDLRGMYGWTLSAHARAAARARGVDVREILRAIQSPEITHTAFNYGPDRYMYKRGDLAVVAARSTKIVITVLWNTPSTWTSEEFSLARSA